MKVAIIVGILCVVAVFADTDKPEGTCACLTFFNEDIATITNLHGTPTERVDARCTEAARAACRAAGQNAHAEVVKHGTSFGTPAAHENCRVHNDDVVDAQLAIYCQFCGGPLEHAGDFVGKTCCSNATEVACDTETVHP